MTKLGPRLESDYGKHDGVLCFNRLYLAVTKGLERALRRPGYFRNPGMIEELDVLFARLYFDTVTRAHRDPQPTRAWQQLLDARSNRTILPIQFALAGMSAHINHDLPIALLEQWSRHGRRPSRADGAYADFDKINEILKTEEALLKRDFDQGVSRQLDSGELGRLEDKLALWVVEDARARAWRNAAHLWSVRHVPPVRAAVLAALDRTAGAIARVLLEPV
jgi:hypothetical protein